MDIRADVSGLYVYAYVYVCQDAVKHANYAWVFGCEDDLHFSIAWSCSVETCHSRGLHSKIQKIE